MQRLVNTDAKDSQVLQHTVTKLTVYTCQRAEELIINICKKQKIGSFRSAAVGARSGRQQLQLNQKALAQGRIGNRSSPIDFHLIASRHLVEFTELRAEKFPLPYVKNMFSVSAFGFQNKLI